LQLSPKKIYKDLYLVIYMKKRYSLTIGDLTLIELADIFAGVFIVSLFLSYFPVEAVDFFTDWVFAFLVLAIFLGIKPFMKILKQKKDVEEKEMVKNKEKKREQTLKSKKAVKKSVKKK
jgi:amino acid permease